MRFRRVGKYKVYLDRSRMYIGYFQFFIILLMFMDKYSATAFGIWFYSNAIFTMPAFLLLFFTGSGIVGHLDEKYIRPAEQKNITSTNPIHMEVLKIVKEINKKI